MSLNPETLQEDRGMEKLERQRRTGTVGNGLTVYCSPYPEDPGIQRQTHRAVCISRPYPNCPFCPHSVFTLFFDGNPDSKYEIVACPRWNSETDRLSGKAPEEYVPTEMATCKDSPFIACTTCPSVEDVAAVGADKKKGEWYSRWQRLRRCDE